MDLSEYVPMTRKDSTHLESSQSCTETTTFRSDLWMIMQIEDLMHSKDDTLDLNQSVEEDLVLQCP